MIELHVRKKKLFYEKFKPFLLEYYQIKFGRYGSWLSNKLKRSSKDTSNGISKCYASEEKPSILPCLFVRRGSGGWGAEFYQAF